MQCVVFEWLRIGQLLDAPLYFKGWAECFFNTKNLDTHMERRKKIDPHGGKQKLPCTIQCEPNKPSAIEWVYWSVHQNLFIQTEIQVYRRLNVLTLNPEREKPIWREIGWAIMWWLPRVSIRGPLAQQPRDSAGQATVCRCPASVLVRIGVPVMTQSHLMHFLSSIL